MSYRSVTGPNWVTLREATGDPEGDETAPLCTFALSFGVAQALRQPLSVRTNQPSESRSLAETLKELMSGVAHLVAQHIALARVELQTALQSAARSVGVLVLMSIPVLMGYAMAMVSLSLFVGHSFGAPKGFALVAVGNFAVGLSGMAIAMKRLRRPVPKTQMVGEIKESLSLLTSASGASRVSSR